MPLGMVRFFSEHDAVVAYLRLKIPEGLFVVIWGADKHPLFLRDFCGLSGDEVTQAILHDFIYFRPKSIDWALEIQSKSKADYSAPYVQIWRDGEVLDVDNVHQSDNSGTIS